MYQFMKENNQKRLKYSTAFQLTFHRGLGDFWDIITGFDVIKFDEEVIKPPDGTSTRDQILKDYGEDTVKLVEGLI
uniref:Uncharacterized protein n=2 Tax=viral metagenome TaxID=1070528 RepID=A0A6M3KK05_9ZZZZ